MQEIAGNSKEVGPRIFERHIGSFSTKQAEVTLLQQVLGDILPATHAHDIAPQRFRCRIIERTESLLIHVRWSLALALAAVLNTDAAQGTPLPMPRTLRPE